MTGGSLTEAAGSWSCLLFTLGADYTGVSSSVKIHKTAHA